MSLSAHSVGYGSCWRNALVVGLGMLLFAGCRAPKTVILTNGASPPQRIAGILTEKLNQAHLRQAWTAMAPLGRAKKIQNIFYHQGRLYVITDHNQLIAYDGATGILHWSTMLSNANMDCSPPAFYQDAIWFALGNRAVEIHRDGQMLHDITLAFKPTTTVMRMEDRIFAGDDKGWFYAIRLADGVPLWQTSGDHDARGVVAAAGDNVYFTRADGTIQVSRAKTRSLVWQAQTAGPCAGVWVDADQCLVPSRDTALYCFVPDTGQLRWKYLAGGSLAEMPRVTAQAIYQVVENHSLMCLDRRTGTLRWELPLGRYFLAENDEVSYVLTVANELFLMNNRNGRPMVSFYVPDMTFFAANTENAMIYMALANGHILALKPDASR